MLHNEIRGSRLLLPPVLASKDSSCFCLFQISSLGVSSRVIGKKAKDKEGNKKDNHKIDNDFERKHTEISPEVSKNQGVNRETKSFSGNSPNHTEMLFRF